MVIGYVRRYLPALRVETYLDDVGKLPLLYVCYILYYGKLYRVIQLE